MANQAAKTWINSAGWVLGILSFINLFNYLDRYLVAALVESLKRSELALSDAQLGLLMSGFLIVYTLAAPLFGALGDRRSRPRLIAFGVGCWSLATMLSGLAGSFAALFAARASVGIGEAAYGTIAPSLLSDFYSQEKRGRIMAIFFCAIPVGSALGFVVGGLMDAHFGWRVAFYVAGFPGILLALLCLGMKDPPRGAQDSSPGTPVAESAAHEQSARHDLASDTRATYRSLLRNPAYVLTVLGYAAYTFAMGGLAYWMPAFLERVQGQPRAQATVSFGAIVVVTGFIGTFAGGWLGDYAARRARQAHLWISAIATLLAAPFVWGALSTGSSSLYLVCMVIAQLLLFLSTGPINAALVNLVLPTQRASAVALEVFAIHALGDCISPYLIGVISDASSLRSAVQIVPVAVVVSGIVWALAARRAFKS